jgi:flavin reductase (DIM6/NTAB) family NADH-FMN oxidoreductase RutF
VTVVESSVVRGSAPALGDGEPAPALPAPDVTWFRDAMAAIASTVTVVTAMTTDQPRGSTVSAFMSLSLNPPMVVAALDRSSSLLGHIRATRLFGVNVLGSEQAELAKSFAYRVGAEKFAGVSWQVEHGVPRLTEAPGWLVCDVADLVDAGDHVMVLGTVQRAETHPGSMPLTYHRRSFGTHAPSATVNRSEVDLFFDLWT